VSLANQQIARTLLRPTHQSRLAPAPRHKRGAAAFHLIFNNLPQSPAVRAAAGTAPALSIVEQRLKLFKPTQHLSFSHFWRTAMKIENLSKDLDAKTMTAVRGGDNGNSATNTIGQVTNLCAPVAVLSGGPSNTSVHVDSTQNAKIWNGQYAGDSYLALLPCYF
jgi:hypothetical protein